MLIGCVIPYPQGIYISRGLRRCSSLDYLGNATASWSGTSNKDRLPRFIYILAIINNLGIQALGVSLTKRMIMKKTLLVEGTGNWVYRPVHLSPRLNPRLAFLL